MYAVLFISSWTGASIVFNDGGCCFVGGSGLQRMSEWHGTMILLSTNQRKEFNVNTKGMV
jgi:hypothetical protein